MTDKQMIIDGVDVSGCVAFKYDGIKKPLCRAGGITSVYKSCLCADNSNCYYKQLKLKEQECEKLKEEIKTNGFGCFNIEMSEQLDQFKAKNEELKAKIKYMEEYIQTVENARNDLKRELEQKEQECEELKKIINEAKNSKLDLKSFLVGEAVQNEYEQQLDQLKAENEELKEENFTFEQLIKEYEKYGAIEEIVQQLNQLKLENEHLSEKEEEAKHYLEEAEKFKNCLTEIKEIAEKSYRTPLAEKDCIKCDEFLEQILQKISESEK